MRENTVKRAWRDGKVVYGCWLSIPSSFSAEVMAHQGYDYVCVDMQHGVIDYQTAVTMLQAISTTEAMPFVRVPWNEPGIIGKVLDAGAYGVVIPLVNTREQAEAAVGACRYAPDGYRSFGPVRATYYAGADYATGANREIACIIMIETTTALANIDDILSVPGNVCGGKITGSPFLRMDGQAVFKFAVKVLDEVARETLAQCDLTVGDIDWLIPHQANMRILEATARKLGIDASKLVITVDRQEFRNR